jgi:hypothetical protein
MKIKVLPIPIHTLPQAVRPLCLGLERNLKTLIADDTVTEEEFKLLFWELEDWCVREVKLLVGTTAIKGSGAAA